MDISKRRFILTTISSLCFGTAIAQDDFAEFEKLLNERNKKFDNLVDQAFLRFDQKVRDAYESARKDQEKTWGNVVDNYLPAAKYWVGYDKNDNSRIKLDYEKEETIIEILVDENISEQQEKKEIEKVAVKYIEMGQEEIDDIDPVRSKLDKETNRIKKVSSKDVKPVLDLLTNSNTQVITDSLKKAITQKKTTKSKFNKQKISIKIPFKKKTEKEKIATFKPHVIAMSKKYDIPAALIFAIIKNESAFNPRAISPIPAYGLMQLVPSSGGLDAYRMVFGENIKPKPEELFSPEFNITLGTAYLHILMFRYLKGIKSVNNKKLCVISAYNTGSGNVAKTFTGTLRVKNALPIINSLDHDALYNKLITGLPYEETQKYLKKVYLSMKQYEKYNF